MSCSQRITPTFPSYYEKDPTVLTHPFQVLYADGVTNERTGEPIENKELLPEWQKLKISDEGILIVVHHTGGFTEVRGDTVVYVSDILESVYEKDYVKISEGSNIGGNLKKHLKGLNKKMKDAASNLEFEEAAKLRDEIRKLESTELEITLNITSK